MIEGPAASVGFGCAGLAQLPHSKGRQALLAAAFDSGIRYFDVARMYGLGTAEGELRRLLQERRDELTVATKFGLSFSAGLNRASGVQSAARWIFRRVPALRALAKRRFGGSTERDFSAESARASVAKSLEELGTDRVDLLFLHDPMGVDEIPLDLLDLLESLRECGTVGRYGVATALGAAEAIVGRLPALGSAVQVPTPGDAAYRSAFLTDPARLVSTHGHFQRYLAPLKARLVDSPDGSRALAEALGLEAVSPEAVGASLLLHAHAVNPRGRTLFFSSSPARVRETMRLVAQCDEAAARRVGAAVAGLLGAEAA